MRRSLVMAATAAALLAGVLPARAASDPYRDRQWGLDRIHASESWAASKGAGVTIAIVDTGIDLTHPDLKSKIVSSYSCIGGSCASGGDDDNGHGSHVAGIAAAATGNGVGVAGVAPSAKLMAVKVIDANGSGACSDIESGIRWAADRGADVINLSLGPEILKGNPLGVLCTDGLEAAAQYAWDRGDVVVIAAGNDGLFSLYSSPDLLVVGATGPDDRPASYSNSGADVYAPGGDPSGSCDPSDCVFSTYENGLYASIAGTSMAAPHVSGVAAQLLAKGYTNSQAIARIKSTADSINGIRRVNAARAVGTSSSSPGPTKSSKPRSGSSQSPASGGSAGGAGSTPASTSTPGSAATPSVSPTTGAPSSRSSPTTDGALASPRRRASSPSRAGLIVGVPALVVLAAAATIVVRRRSRGEGFVRR